MDRKIKLQTLIHISSPNFAGFCLFVSHKAV